MADPVSFLKGLLFGVAIAAPVGPIALLCVSRTLTRGWLTGFASGLGAATADALYGVVVACGYTVIGRLLFNQLYWLQLAGSVVLVYLGMRILFSKSVAYEAAVIPGIGLAKAYGTTVLLTLANPMTMLIFATFIAGSKASRSMTIASPLLLVLGVFCGSALWWLCLSGGIGLLGRRLTPRVTGWLNRTSGAIIVLYAVIMLFMH